LTEDIDIKKDLLFFDEIQECPKAINSLKFFFEEMKELAIISA
jgi:predicted AAA+ superfamily ATPase